MASVFPTPLPRSALRGLTSEEAFFWETHGYVAVADAVPLELCAKLASTVRAFVGADDAKPESWYKNDLDIYSELTEKKKKPIHGPCGMVQLSHHENLWRLRQCPRIHDIFSDVYGTEKLWVTTDRAHFKPPENGKFPKWSDAGPVHSGLHWDAAIDDLPLPFAVQGVVYLEDTAADQGALRVVPGSFRDLIRKEAIAVPGKAGTLVLWHSGVLHGPGRNVSTKPRISAYVAMLPVDAEPFQPPGKAPDNPLSLADAGTLDFDDPDKRRLIKRKNRQDRIDRYKYRLPLLDEDPKEDDLERYPPNEPQGTPPFPDLTPLGRKLVGIDLWEE